MFWSFLRTVWVCGARTDAFVCGLTEGPEHFLLYIFNSTALTTGLFMNPFQLQNLRGHGMKEISRAIPIKMNSVVDILIFGIHIKTQRQMTFGSNLAAAAQDSWIAKSKNVWAETRLKMSCSCNGDIIKGFAALPGVPIDHFLRSENCSTAITL